MTTQTVVLPDKTQEGLRRVVGAWGLAANLVNTVIGAGIFVLPAIVAGGLGAAGVLAYLACGLLIIIIMLCFAEVGSKITRTGGAYTYIEEAFGKYAGFLTTNLFIFGSSLMANAAVANALASTVAYAIPAFDRPETRVAFFILIYSGLTIPNIKGVRTGITLVKATMILKVTPLALLMVAGVMNISAENLRWEVMPSLADFGEMSLILFFAFQGAENTLSISGEVRDPRRNIPLGILTGICAVVLIYLAIQTVSQGVLGDELPAITDAPLAAVAGRIIGPVGITLMITGAAISMFGYVSGDVLNMPRVIFGAARDGVIPVKALARVHPRHATPHVAIVFFAILGCAFAIAGEFRLLAKLSSASSLLIYLGVVLATIWLRWKKIQDTGTFRIPGGYIIPLLALGSILWMLSHLTPAEKIGMVFFLAALTGLFLITRFIAGRGSR